jgi:ABC-2 type transport system permease protein
MNWKKVLAVVRREYVERVRTRAFWFGTMLIPGLLLAIIGIQIALARRATGDRRLAVLDATGTLYAPLKAELEAEEKEQKKEKTPERLPHWILEFRPVEGMETQKDELRKEIFAKKIDGYLLLTPDLLKNDQIEYYSTTVSEFTALSQLENAVNKVRLRQKIAARGLSPDLANDLEKACKLRPFRISKKGASEEKGAGIIAALIFFIVMYSTFFMYGAQVMIGVLDEKTNRIVEIIIASVRPTELMIGKMLGIGLVGLTQYFAWAFVAASLSAPGIAAGLASSDLGSPRIPVTMLAYFVLYFILGYFLYASVYTCVAAPFNTNQEAQQLAMIPMVLIVSSIVVYPAVLNNPSGGLSVFFSLFPFTASLTMFLRTSLSEVPAWQIGLSIVSIVVTTAVIASFAGRIYRVGILMYGKKPTIPEILRWARYAPGKTPAPETARAS